MAVKTTTKKARNSKIENVVLPSLYDTPGQTIKELDVQAIYVYTALDEGLVTRTNEPVRSGKRGRPANRFKLTDKARKRVARQRKQGQAQPVAA